MVYDPEYIQARDGIFYSKNEEGVLSENEVTDVAAYKENDTEHVGWFTIPKKAGRPTWVQPYYNKNIDRWMISYVIPLYKDDVFVAVIGMDYDFRDMADKVSSYQFFENGTAVLRNSNGSVHYHEGFFEGKIHGDGDMIISDTDLAMLENANTGEDLITYDYKNIKRVAAVTKLSNGMNIFLTDSYDEVYHDRDLLLISVMIASLVTALVTIFAIRRYLMRMIQPITEITDAIGQIQNQNYDVALPEGNRDEVGILSDGVRMMADTLKKQQEINESTLAERNRQLEIAVRESETANRAKSDFLSQMSHDIRTPMNAIIGMSVIAEDNISNQEKLADCLGKIRLSSNYMLSLINDILDMSRIESGKLSFEYNEFHVAGLIEKTITLVGSQLNAHHHHIQADISGLTHENIIADGLRLQQVFVNILSNAVKYTPDGGEIEITVREIPTASASISHFVFAFRDNGIGMSEEFQKTMFDAFAREKDDHQTEVKGTGLGMAITKTIVEHMGGTISVDSRQGSGTTMTVELDLETSEEIQQTVSEDLRSRTVLVVDDQPDDLNNASDAIRKAGLQCEIAGNGQEALRMIETRQKGEDPYYAIIADRRMPEMDGINLTEQIRESIDADIPVIIFSAYVDVEMEEDALKAGADAFISKPLYAAKLVHTLNSIQQGNSLHENAGGSGLDAFNLQGRRILIADDMLINQEISTVLLSATGAETETADNGQIAVEKFLSHPAGYYDLILMDVRMPIMDGYAATRAIRTSSKEDAESIPIFALSANAYQEDKAASREAGMNGHLTKPIELDQLKEVLQNHLADRN